MARRRGRVREQPMRDRKAPGPRRRAAFETATRQAEAPVSALLQSAGPAPVGLAAALSRASSAIRAEAIHRLQRIHGNAYVQRVVAEFALGERSTAAGVRSTAPAGLPAPPVVNEEQPAATPSPPTVSTGFVDLGNIGSAPFHGAPAAGPAASGGGAPLALPTMAFVARGKLGSAATHWGGGTGGMGFVPGINGADFAQTAPQFEGANPSRPGGSAKAWIRRGTGRLTATRWYRGVLNGANGAAWYLTSRSVRRTDYHEQLHTDSSREKYNQHVKPLLRRVSQHRGRSSARRAGTTQAEAITDLRTYVDWDTSLNDFHNADLAANLPMNTVDTNDLASGTYMADYGPRTVRGVNYQHYVDTPPGPGQRRTLRQRLRGW